MAQAGAAYRTHGQAAQSARMRKEQVMRFNRMMLRIATGLIVFCLFVYIGRMADISAGAKEISRLEEEITKLSEDEKYLRINLATRRNPEEVKIEAMSRLGMRYPVEGEVQLVSLAGFASRSNTHTALDNAAP